MGNETTHLNSSPASLQESKILKARASLLFDRETIKLVLAVGIIFVVGIFAETASTLLWVHVPEGPFLVFLIVFLFSGFIWLLIPLSILFYNYPSTVEVMSEKIIIKKPMRNPVVIEKKDIMEISITESKIHSLRWVVRLTYIILLVFFFKDTVTKALQDLQKEFPYYIVLNLFLMNFILVAFLIVQLYKFELMAPYQQMLNVTTYSNLKLKFFTDDPEELTGLLKT